MKDDNFDKFLSRSLKAGEIEVNTPINQVEQMIIEKIKINRDNKRKRQRLIIQVAVLVIALLGISGSMLFPQPVYAFKEKVIQTILNFGKMINITVSSDQNPPQLKDKIGTEVAAVQPSVSFKIIIPKYIPLGFEFKNLTRGATDEQDTIIISFASQNASILITETRVPSNFTYSMNIDAKQGKSEKIQVGRYEGNLITFLDGSCSLTWITDDSIMCQLFGNLTIEQAKEMAVSM